MKKLFRLNSTTHLIVVMIIWIMWIWLGYELFKYFLSSKEFHQFKEEYLESQFSIFIEIPFFIASLVIWIYFPAFITIVYSDVVTHKKRFWRVVINELRGAKNYVGGMTFLFLFWIAGTFFLAYFGGLLQLLWVGSFVIYFIVQIGIFLFKYIRNKINQ